MKEVMDSLHALVEQGKVLYLGISDTPAYIVSACNTYALENGKTPFSIYQGRWNIIKRDMEREVIPMCRHFGMVSPRILFNLENLIELLTAKQAIAPWDAIGGGK